MNPGSRLFRTGCSGRVRCLHLQVGTNRHAFMCDRDTIVKAKQLIPLPQRLVNMPARSLDLSWRWSLYIWCLLLLIAKFCLNSRGAINALECSNSTACRQLLLRQDHAAQDAAPIIPRMQHGRLQKSGSGAVNDATLRRSSSSRTDASKGRESQTHVQLHAGARTSTRRLLQQIPKGIRLELMHRDHEQSPLLDAENLTLAGKIRRDVARSRAREQSLSRRMTQYLKDNDKLSAADDNTDTFEARLSTTGAEYVMNFMLGTPPQKFVVVVDTGSDLVWVQCLPCAQCFQQVDNVFDSQRSSSYQPLACSSPACNALGSGFASCSSTCQYEYSYGDQSSTSGDFSSETVTLVTTSGASQAVSNFAFGCGHKNQGTFHSTDGLVGLGQGSYSFSSQLGNLFGKKFSYCLVSRGQAVSHTSPLLFGEAAAPMASKGLQFTPLLSSNPGVESFYYVGLEGLSVSGSPLSVAPDVFTKSESGIGGTIFDSGTTFTQLTSAAYDEVVAALKTAIPYPQATGSPNVGLDLCFDITGILNVEIPALTFHFIDADLVLPGSNTFVLVETASTMCLAISRSSSSLNIFGNTQQQNFQILYDRENSRIGFTPLTCSSL